MGSVQTVTSQNYSELTTEHLSYDAYGRRRDAGNNSSIITQNPISDVTKRGYTGQEHVDQLGVINYNARLYDPELGMMLQADTIIPDGPVTQSLNRYSYVFNNPLSYTDPTGHSPIGWPNPYSLQRLNALNELDQVQDEAEDLHHAEQQMAVTPQGMHEAVVGIHQFDGVGVQFNPETFEIEEEGMLEGVVGPMFKNMGKDLVNSTESFNQMFIYPTTDLLGSVGDRLDPVVYTMATTGPIGNVPKGLGFLVSKVLRGIGKARMLISGSRITKNWLSINELPFNASAFNFTDSLADKQFTKLVKNIRTNGLKNPVIKYVDVAGEPYIVHGNNRYLATRLLNKTDELQFHKVDFPVDGTNFRNAQDVIETVGTVRIPRYRGR